MPSLRHVNALPDKPDLITLDIQLPGVDGWEFLASIRGDVRLGAVPVVIVSAKDETVGKRVFIMPGLLSAARARNVATGDELQLFLS